jgi:hypothetical protein
VSACELEAAIKRVGTSPRALPKAYFTAQARFLSGVWALAAGADFVWPGTTGTRPPRAALMRPYLRLLGEAAHCDPAVMRKVIRVFHLLDLPSSVAAPSTVLAVLASRIKRRWRSGFRSTSIEMGTMPPLPTVIAS